MGNTSSNGKLSGIDAKLEKRGIVLGPKVMKLEDDLTEELAKKIANMAPPEVWFEQLFQSHGFHGRFGPMEAWVDIYDSYGEVVGMVYLSSHSTIKKEVTLILDVCQPGDANLGESHGINLCKRCYVGQGKTTEGKSKIVSWKLA